MDQDIIRLLQKYIANRCTPQELQQIQHVLKSGRYEQEWAAVLHEEAVNDMADESKVNDFDAERVLSRINSTITPARKISVSQWTLGIAASLLLIFSAAYLFWSTRVQAVKNTEQVTLVTLAGQQKKITLTDGTEVILNCGSRLRYTTAFAGKKREVYLEGEAFFKVVHDVDHPFLVHTGRVNVQVLGTSFNVKSYREDAGATVSVSTGKVGVNGVRPTGTYMLLPGERLSCNSNNNFKKDRVSQDDILGWQKGMLNFRLETIREIAPVLERYYGINIIIKPTRIPHKQVTASFNRKTLPQVLEILSQTAGFNYTIIKNEVHIY